jgi:hypothetical protein
MVPGKWVLAGAFAAATTIGGTVASAATITFETDEAGFVSVGSVGGTQTGGVAQGPFAAAGTTFTIDADTFSISGGNILLNGETNIEITQNNEGLGVDNNNGPFGADSGEIDGFADNDILVFSFARPVRLFDIIFENVTGNDDFVFYLPGTTPNAALYDIINPLPVADTDGDEGFFGFGGIVVSTFGIGASGGNDNFRVSKIDVEAVPLPAAGWMLLAGLGGLAAMRRRRAD